MLRVTHARRQPLPLEARKKEANLVDPPEIQVARCGDSLTDLDRNVGEHRRRQGSWPCPSRARGRRFATYGTPDEPVFTIFNLGAGANPVAAWGRGGGNGEAPSDTRGSFIGDWGGCARGAGGESGLREAARLAQNTGRDAMQWISAVVQRSRGARHVIQ